MNNTISKHGRSTIELLAGGIIGMMFWTLTSHPKSKVHQNWPNIKIKNLELQPHIKYTSKEKTYHFHHWMNLAALYIPIIAIRKGILKSRILHGFFLGSIIQGLLYKDRFHIRKKIEDSTKEEKTITSQAN